MSKPVVIRSFINPNDAYAAKGVLEDAGIPTFLYDQYAITTVPIVFTGVKIAVPDVDAEEALRILDEIFISSEAILPDDLLQDEQESIICPKCNSDKISTKPGYKPFWYKVLKVLSLFFIVTLSNTSPKKQWYKCLNCHNIWRE